MIQSLKNFHLYENFAYHISLLRQFASIHTRNTGGGKGADGDEQVSSVHGSNVWSMLSKKKHLGSSSHRGDPDTSVKSNNSFKGGGMGMRRISTATGALNSMA